MYSSKQRQAEASVGFSCPAIQSLRAWHGFMPLSIVVRESWMSSESGSKRSQSTRAASRRERGWLGAGPRHLASPPTVSAWSSPEGVGASCARLEARAEAFCSARRGALRLVTRASTDVLEGGVLHEEARDLASRGDERVHAVRSTPRFASLTARAEATRNRGATRRGRSDRRAPSDFSPRRRVLSPRGVAAPSGLHFHV